MIETVSKPPLDIIGVVGFACIFFYLLMAQ